MAPGPQVAPPLLEVVFHLQDPSRGSGGAFLTTTSAPGTGSSGSSKLHKPSKDQRHKKEPKSAFKESVWEASKASKDAPGKARETQPLQDINSKIGFKESKAWSKEPQTEDEDPDPGLSKRPSRAHGDRHPAKKRKKGLAISDFDGQHLEKKASRDGSRGRRGRQGRDDAERGKAPRLLPPFREVVDPNDSEAEDRPRSDVSGRSGNSELS